MAVQINVVGQYSGRDIERARRELGKLGDQGESVAARFKRAGGKMADALKTAAAGAAVAAGAAISKGVVDAINLDGVEDRMAAQLGLTAEQSAAFGKAAGNLYAQAYGDSVAQVGDALAAVQSSLGEALGPAEDALEATTAKALDMAAAFDMDVNEAVNAAGIAVRSGLAKDADEAFDLMVSSMQQVPAAMRGELIPILEEYSQSFGALGIEGDDAFGLLTNAANNGRFELDKVGDALKELTIRGTDMSAASVEAFEKAGLNADQMAARFLEGGDSAKGALDDVVDGLLGMEDPTERANAAIALFGTPLEDLGTAEIPDFLASLDTMGSSLGDVGGAAERMGDTLNDNLGTRLEEIKRRGFMALADAADKYLLPALDWASQNAIPAMQQAWERVQPPIAAARDLIVGGFQTVQRFLADNQATFDTWSTRIGEVATQVTDTLSAAFDTIVAVIETGVGIATEFWDRFGSHIVDYLQRTVGRIIEVLSRAFDVIKGLFDTITGILTGDWSKAWEGIKSTVSGAWGIITGVFTQALDGIKTALGAAVAVISQVWSGAWNGIKGVVSGAWDAIKGMVSGGVENLVGAITSIPGRLLELHGQMLTAGRDLIGKLFEGIVNAATSVGGFALDIGKSVANAIIDLFNSQVVTRINSGLPNSLGFGRFSIDLPDNPLPRIPRLAQGGIQPAVPGGRLAIIGEGGRDEAVIPLPHDWRNGSSGPLGGTNVTIAANAVRIHLEVAPGMDVAGFRRAAREVVDDAIDDLYRQIVAGAGAA